MAGMQAQYPDGGHRWIVAICSAVLSGIGNSIYKCIGQVYVSMLQTTSYTRSQIASVVILPGVLASVTAIFAVKLAELYSFRFTLFLGSFLFGLGLCLSSLATNSLPVFTLTFVILGIGVGCCLTTSNVVVGLYFKEKRSFAMGLVTSLAGTIAFFMPITIQLFLNEFRLKGALLLWGAVALHGCVAAMLIRQPTWALQRPKPKINVNKDENQKFLESETPNQPNPKRSLSAQICFCFKLVVTQLIRDCRHFRKFIFSLLLFSRMAFFFTLISVPLILPQFAMEQIESISVTQSAFLLSVISIGDVAAKLLGGWLNNYVLSKHKRTAYLISKLCIATILLSFQFTHSYPAILAVCVFYGLFNGYVFVTYFLIMFDTFGPVDAPGGIALHIGLFGVCSVATGPIMARIRDLTGSYRHCFTLLVLILVASVTLWLGNPVISYIKKKNLATLNATTQLQMYL
uniref:Major facilitator superfamily (MFS) profile domain-containing protein n=1 Tax=Strigamia maritima TaxID=126957 RepID=T1J2R5_STRMM